MPTVRRLPAFVVVEDDPFDVHHLKNILASVAPDYPVVVCRDGAEAVPCGG